MYHLPVKFSLPTISDDYRWVRIIDTASWAEPDYNCWSLEKGVTMVEREYEVEGFAIAVFQEVTH
jgi:glycogen operon protein